MRWQLLALAASVAGLAVSIYLTVVHYAGVPLACPANATISCEAVLSSKFAVIAGTSNPAHMEDNLAAGRGRPPNAAERRKMVEFFTSLG